MYKQNNSVRHEVLLVIGFCSGLILIVKSVFYLSNEDSLHRYFYC